METKMKKVTQKEMDDEKFGVGFLFIGSVCVMLEGILVVCQSVFDFPRGAVAGAFFIGLATVGFYAYRGVRKNLDYCYVDESGKDQ